MTIALNSIRHLHLFLKTGILRIMIQMRITSLKRPTLTSKGHRRPLLRHSPVHTIHISRYISIIALTHNLRHDRMDRRLHQLHRPHVPLNLHPKDPAQGITIHQPLILRISRSRLPSSSHGVSSVVSSTAFSYSTYSSKLDINLQGFQYSTVLHAGDT